MAAASSLAPGTGTPADPREGEAAWAERMPVDAQGRNPRQILGPVLASDGATHAGQA